MTAGPVTPGKRALFGGIIIALVLLISLLLAEGAVRVRQWLKYGTASSLEATFRVDPASGLRVPIPDRLPKSVRINSLGFRSPELTSPKPPGTVRLAFLGGSTTYCGEASSNEATWPHLVWQTVQGARKETTFDYLNAGVPGYGIDALQKTLEYRVKELSPDVIVIYEATNDLSFESARLAREQGLLVGRPDQGSWVGRYLLLWFLVEKNLTVRHRQAEATNGASKLSVDARELSRGFEQRLTALVTASRAAAPVVVVVTFASRLRRGQSADEQRRAAVTAAYYMPQMTTDGMIRGFEEYNRVIRDVATRQGTVLVEGADAVPADAVHYTDSVHFTDAGSRALAARVSETLLSAPAFTALLADRAGRHAGRPPGAPRPVSSRSGPVPATASN
jgi:lysophospholipase L1-like esterase